MRRALGLATVAVVVVLGATTRATGDGIDHTHQPVIVAVEPPVDGLTVEVRPEPAPTIVVRNDTGRTLEVLHDGAPFLRIGPDVVEADVTAAAFYRSESPSSAADVPPSAAGGTDGPRFARLIDGAAWAWFEHRIAATPVDEQWRIPIRVGGVAADIIGRWEAVDVPARVVSTVEPVPVDGLRVEVLPGLSPGLYVGNDTGDALEIDGPRGEPFLRIGPDDTTRARPDGGVEVVAPTPSYGWVDPRMGWQGDPPDRRARRDWRIPTRLGDRDIMLTGTVEWVPLDGDHDGSGDGDRWWTRPAIGAGVLVGVIAVVIFAIRTFRPRRT